MNCGGVRLAVTRARWFLPAFYLWLWVLFAGNLFRECFCCMAGQAEHNRVRVYAYSCPLSWADTCCRLKQTHEGLVPSDGAFPMMWCCAKSLFHWAETGEHLVFAPLEQADVPQPGPFVQLGWFWWWLGPLTCRYGPVWAGTGCLTSSRSPKGHVSANGFTRLTSCFIILPYYKHSINR